MMNNKSQNINFVETYSKTESDVDKKQNVQLLRRIDWRFLLPNPNLSRVAYWGNPKSLLFETIRMFSEFCSLILPDDAENYSDKNRHPFDLLVGHFSSFSEIKKASNLLKQDGHLYWEIDRSFLFKKLLQKQTISHKIKRKSKSNSKNQLIFPSVHFYFYDLLNYGFTDVEIFWHRPNFINCLEIIPLKDAATLSYVFQRNLSNFKGQVKSGFGWFLLKSGLLPYVFPNISVVARKSNL